MRRAVDRRRDAGGLAGRALDVEKLEISAVAFGIARAALTEAWDYAQSRVQFGKPISEFQLTQAALADMATELDAARLLVFRAAWEKDQPAADGRASATSVAMAKMYAVDITVRW